MDLYSRYRDKDGNLYSIIRRTGKIRVSDLSVEPSTITLLNVNRENAKEIDIKTFLQLIDPEAGKLTRIK